MRFFYFLFFSAAAYACCAVLGVFNRTTDGAVTEHFIDASTYTYDNGYVVMISDSADELSGGYADRLYVQDDKIRPKPQTTEKFYAEIFICFAAMRIT